MIDKLPAHWIVAPIDRKLAIPGAADFFQVLRRSHFVGIFVETCE